MKSGKCFSLLIVLMLLFAGAAQALTVGEQMPQTVFQTADHGDLSLEELLKARKMVLINVFATWCGPCAAEFPLLEESYQRWKDRAEVIAVSAEPNDDLAAIRSYMQEKGLSFPAVPGDRNEMAEALGVTAFPTTFVIDRFGNIALRLVGAQTQEDSFERIFSYFCDDAYTVSGKLETLPPVANTKEALPDAELTALVTEDARIRAETPVSAYVWPFVSDGGEGAVSSNTGANGSVSCLRAVVRMDEEAVFSCRVYVSSERYFDALEISVNGKTVRSFSGTVGWMDFACPLPQGETELSFRYAKDPDAQDGEDLARIAGMRVLTGSEAQEALAAQPVWPTAGETGWAVLDSDARAVSVNDPYGVFAAVFGPAQVWLLDKAEAPLSLRLSREDPWTVGVAMNGEQVPQEILDKADADGYPFTLQNPDSYGLAAAWQFTLAGQHAFATAVVFRTENDLNGLVDYLNLSYGADISWTEESALPAAAAPVWTVRAADADGAPVPGCMVQFCTDQTCSFVRTDETGTAVFEGEALEYHVTVLKVPEGYALPEGWEAVLPAAGGEADVTIPAA